MRDNIIETTIKRVKTVQFIRDFKENFEQLVYSSTKGLTKPKTWEEMKETFGQPAQITEEGKNNLRKKLYGIVACVLDYGDNIGGQVVDKLTKDDYVKIIRNIEKVFKQKEHAISF